MKEQFKDSLKLAIDVSKGLLAAIAAAVVVRLASSNHIEGTIFEITTRSFIATAILIPAIFLFSFIYVVFNYDE
ncbi:MAG: hypothetical protein V2I33_07030, partial [Kangiellaceae bacterium]|nr:hypothetical protein [Kangiellaceae bacterium]